MTNQEALAMNKLFVVNIDRWVKRCQGNADIVVQKVLFKMAQGVITRTPVDTGRLRGNWQFGTGVIPKGVTGEIDKTPLGSDGGPTMARVSVGSSQARAGTLHYITNNLPYAPVIEYGQYPANPKSATGKTAGGYSIQAPAGMVRVTAVEVKDYLVKAVLEVRRGIGSE